jgi:hypothetical protein
MKKKISVAIANYQMARIFVTSREKQKQFSRLEKQVLATAFYIRSFHLVFWGYTGCYQYLVSALFFLCLIPKYFMFFDAFQQIVLTLRPESMEL